MGVTKSELFTRSQNLWSLRFKALSHPARIAILEFMMKSESCINSNLQEELGLAQATISQHLRELKEAGFIKGTVSGKSVSYCLDYEFIQSLGVDLNQTLSNLPNENNPC